MCSISDWKYKKRRKQRLHKKPTNSSCNIRSSSTHSQRFYLWQSFLAYVQTYRISAKLAAWTSTLSLSFSLHFLICIYRQTHIYKHIITQHAKYLSLYICMYVNVKRTPKPIKHTHTRSSCVSLRFVCFEQLVYVLWHMPRRSSKFKHVHLRKRTEYILRAMGSKRERKREEERERKSMNCSNYEAEKMFDSSSSREWKTISELCIK